MRQSARGIGRSIYKVCGGEIHEETEPAEGLLFWKKEMSILVVGRGKAENSNEQQRVKSNVFSSGKK